MPRPAFGDWAVSTGSTVQFPNASYAPLAQQRLREIQEVLAEAEFRAGHFYYHKGSHYAAANRLQGLTDHYPLFSQADTALWELGDAYSKMGVRFNDKSAAAFAKIVREYPLSARVDEAKARLTAMEREIPDTDPIAYARMKYELENREKPGFMDPIWGIFKKSPDVRMAAKSGSPVMESLRPLTPASIPTNQPGGTGLEADVSVSAVSDSSALDNNPDARQNVPSSTNPNAATTQNGEPNPDPKATQKNGKDDKKKKK